MVTCSKTTVSAVLDTVTVTQQHHLSGPQLRIAAADQNDLIQGGPAMICEVNDKFVEPQLAVEHFQQSMVCLDEALPGLSEAEGDHVRV